jgi:hypothetical protein
MPDDGSFEMSALLGTRHPCQLRRMQGTDQFAIYVELHLSGCRIADADRFGKSISG